MWFEFGNTSLLIHVAVMTGVRDTVVGPKTPLTWLIHVILKCVCLVKEI